LTDLFRYTLLGDGSSDRCLVPVINWALRQIQNVPLGFTAQIADLRENQPRVSGLSRRIEEAWRQFPCEVLFVHRDAEGMELSRRLEEIEEATRAATDLRYVPLVPVRMTEAWLLIDETAIRKAADNPNGTENLKLPPIQKLESLPDPKHWLHEALVLASEKKGRMLQQFKRDLPSRIHRVAALIDDFSPLRRLPAFHQFESLTRDRVQSLL
jgi:hypothetical protein